MKNVRVSIILAVLVAINMPLAKGKCMPTPTYASLILVQSCEKHDHGVLYITGKVLQSARNDTRDIPENFLNMITPPKVGSTYHLQRYMNEAGGKQDSCKEYSPGARVNAQLSFPCYDTGAPKRKADFLIDDVENRTRDR